MDKGASVLAKLKNKAKETGKSLQVHLQLFCQEEFLRKLSMSEYADNLVLKGGLGSCGCAVSGSLRKIIRSRSPLETAENFV